MLLFIKTLRTVATHYCLQFYEKCCLSGSHKFSQGQLTYLTSQLKSKQHVDCSRLKGSRIRHVVNAEVKRV